MKQGLPRSGPRYAGRGQLCEGLEYSILESEDFIQEVPFTFAELQLTTSVSNYVVSCPVSFT